MARDTIRLGKIKGISIELHWTLVALLIVSLISPVFFLLIVLLFLSVFVHELSHSLTSLNDGVSVSKIVLNPLGGASMVDEVNLKPELEFRISVVGPLTNLLLAAIFGIMVLFTPLGFYTLIVQFMFLINLLLGISNILPIFPMDGSRIFRSYLQRTRSKYDATMLTVKVSKYLLAALVVGTLGFAFLAPGYTLEYRFLILIWVLFIVVLLYGSTRSEEELTVLGKETKGLKIDSAMRRHFALVDRNKRLSALYGQMRGEEHHAFITKLGTGYGVVNLVRGKLPKNATYVRDIATPVPSIDHGAAIVDALAQVSASELGVAVVTRRGKAVGVLTASHLQTFIQLHLIHKREKGEGKGSREQGF